MQISDTLNIARFDSMAEFGRLCAQQQIQNREPGKDNHFTGSLSAPRAAQLCVDGDESQVAAAEKLMALFESSIETTSFMDLPSVAGCYPCVPEAISGEPECMREPTQVGDDRAPMSILVDLATSAALTPEQVRRRGIAILALTMALSATRPISLDVMCVLEGAERNSAPGEKFMILTVHIETMPLDLATAAYALTHVGFARQLIYGYGKRHMGFAGEFAYFRGGVHDPESPQYLRRVEELLNLDGDVLTIPAAISDNEKIITNPTGWVRDQLDKYAGVMAEAY